MKSDRQCGFSLVEMLIVIMVISALTFMGIPQWIHYKKRVALIHTSHHIVAFLSRIKSQADLYNQTYQLTIAYRDEVSTLQAYQVGREGAGTMQLHYVATTGVIVVPGRSEHRLIFYGKRSMTSGGSLEIVNEVGRIFVIVSSKGRIRRCSNTIKTVGITLCD